MADPFPFPDENPTRYPGALVFDCMPVEGAFTDRFEQVRTIDGRVSMHGGEDIAASAGTPIVAPARGRVNRLADPSHVFGNHVILDHGGTPETNTRYYSLYAHLSAFDGVGNGDVAVSGDRIGLVGETGLAFGAHLHWAVSTTKGFPLSPYPAFAHHEDLFPPLAFLRRDDDGPPAEAVTMNQWSDALARRLGWPVSEWTRDVLAFWAGQESGGELLRWFNPLATTRPASFVARSTVNIGFGPGNWNSAEVGMFATLENGVEATAQTIELSYYRNVVRAFVDQRGNTDMAADLRTWSGSSEYAERIRDFAVARSVAVPAPLESGVRAQTDRSMRELSAMRESLRHVASHRSAETVRQAFDALVREGLLPPLDE